MQIIGISGSPRRGGNSDLILETILTQTRRSGARTQTVFLSELDFSSCVGCERCREDRTCTRFEDGFTPLYPKITEALGMVLVTPVYNYNITSWMKAFIDRLYCFYDFDNDRPRNWSSRLGGQDRQAVLAVVAEQTSREDLGVAMEALRLPMQALGYGIVEEIILPGMFDAGIVGRDPASMEKAEEAGRSLSLALDL
jgi:multimeric flavodoxin WrbA